jgi:hypothetical protein
VFARGRVADGPVDLRFHYWDVDRFCERVVIPYHVKLSLEGLPHHAWYQEVSAKILGDEALIHHVDNTSRRREDFRFYVCWAFSQNPSCIPHVVYITLSDALGDPQLPINLHFTHPHSVKHDQVFKVLIHIDSVEDLLFYHHPPEQLNADGRVQLRELCWIPGRPNGELDDEIIQPLERYCRLAVDSRRRPRDDDEEEPRGRRRSRGRDFFDGVSRWFGNQRRDMSDNEG